LFQKELRLGKGKTPAGYARVSGRAFNPYRCCNLHDKYCD